MKGRKPIPIAVHKLRGNPSNLPPSRLQEAQPAGPASLEPPECLSAPAKDEWRRLAPMLARLRVLTETDTDTLQAYCETWVSWKEAIRQLRKHGMVDTSGDYPKVSPYMKVVHEAQTQLRALLVELGMTPSARARIRTPPVIETPVSKWGGSL